jgi:hypothetical protein
MLPTTNHPLRWLMVGIGVASATALAQLSAPSHLPLWAVALVGPGVIGELLVGGVHGGAPEWLRAGAWSVANGAFWAAAFKGLSVIARRVGRLRNS